MNTSLATASPTRTTKDERRRVTGRVKLACDAMVWEGLDWQTAAAKANLHIRSMRLALERPHVKQYLNEQKQVFRASASAQNISRLVSIRDQDDNKMASLGAIKALEQIDDSQAGAGMARSPGIVIVIGSPPRAGLMGHERTIEAKPLIGHDAVSHAVAALPSEGNADD